MTHKMSEGLGHKTAAKQRLDNIKLQLIISENLRLLIPNLIRTIWIKCKSPSLCRSSLRIWHG